MQKYTDKQKDRQIQLQIERQVDTLIVRNTLINRKIVVQQMMCLMFIEYFARDSLYFVQRQVKYSALHLSIYSSIYRVTQKGQTNVRNLFCTFSCIQGSLQAKAGLFLSLINYQNTLLNAETKILQSFVSSLQYYPLLVTLYLYI